MGQECLKCTVRNARSAAGGYYVINKWGRWEGVKLAGSIPACGKRISNLLLAGSYGWKPCTRSFLFPGYNLK
jgi:hypothetical protein